MMICGEKPLYNDTSQEKRLQYCQQHIRGRRSGSHAADRPGLPGLERNAALYQIATRLEGAPGPKRLLRSFRLVNQMAAKAIPANRFQILDPVAAANLLQQLRDRRAHADHGPTQ
jgi:hypothetical protein